MPSYDLRRRFKWKMVGMASSDGSCAPGGALVREVGVAPGGSGRESGASLPLSACTRGESGGLEVGGASGLRANRSD